MAVRKKYSKKFKLDAESLIKEQHYNRSEVVKRLGINANMLEGGQASAMRISPSVALRSRLASIAVCMLTLMKRVSVFGCS